MINLIPYDTKAEIRAGRLNTILRSYIVMLFTAILLLAVLFGLAFITLTADRQNAQHRVQENDQAISQYSDVKAAADKYRADLGTAKQILGKSINYSDLILKISGTVPSGVVLTTLTLDAKSIGTPTLLTVYAKDQAAVLAFKASMQSHTELFSDVSLQGLQSRDVVDPKLPYAYTATLNVTINKKALE
jgi:Tfp pilus assembly protein PilN